MADDDNSAVPVVVEVPLTAGEDLSALRTLVSNIFARADVDGDGCITVDELVLSCKIFKLLATALVRSLGLAVESLKVKPKDLLDLLILLISNVIWRTRSSCSMPSSTRTGMAIFHFQSFKIL